MERRASPFSLSSLIAEIFSIASPSHGANGSVRDDVCAGRFNSNATLKGVLCFRLNRILECHGLNVKKANEIYYVNVNSLLVPAIRAITLPSAIRSIALPSAPLPCHRSYYLLSLQLKLSSIMTFSDQE